MNRGALPLRAMMFQAVGLKTIEASEMRSDFLLRSRFSLKKVKMSLRFSAIAQVVGRVQVVREQLDEAFFFATQLRA